ncbi:hypothetical protein [Campylobacter sp. RM12651]|uniref:DUF7446 family protein n=1 Tax=Campylobacter sp. RM12651 TaxID=1660079 RepID=UPI001EFBC797|nr:hypothetical protein [Campylobacter sp. RM12651]ULO03758.1 hypothetical protein AVBRAN_1304 [Campylobacter sp. RM12651]
MKLENIKIGASPISNRIYVGELNKNQTEWKNKVDVTDDVVLAMITYLKNNNNNIKGSFCSGNTKVDFKLTLDLKESEIK